MDSIQVFLGSDVIVAALLSKNGASFALIQNESVNIITSTTVRQEVFIVAERLSISPGKLMLLDNLKIIQTNIPRKRVIKHYTKYVNDPEDSHVVASAHKTNSSFLLSHNTKHYNSKKIKSELGIILMKPGNFLQYLRNF